MKKKITKISLNVMYLSGTKIGVCYSPHIGVYKTKMYAWVYHPIGKFYFCFCEISLVFYVNKYYKKQFLKWQRKNKL